MILPHGLKALKTTTISLLFFRITKQDISYMDTLNLTAGEMVADKCTITMVMLQVIQHFTTTELLTD